MIEFFLCAHISDFKQISYRRRERSNERNAKEHVCLVESIEKKEPFYNGR